MNDSRGTLWISGEVDQIFIVSVSKVCKSRQDPVQLALIFSLWLASRRLASRQRDSNEIWADPGNARVISDKYGLLRLYHDLPGHR